MTEQGLECADLSCHEPIFEVEDDGLVIRGYEIDGECIVDFSWAPETRWGFLDEAPNFAEFVAHWLEEMTGVPLAPAERQQLRLMHQPAPATNGSGDDLAGDEQQQAADER